MKGKRCDFEYFRIKIYIFIALHVLSLKNIKVNVKRNFSNTTLTSLVLRTTVSRGFLNFRPGGPTSSRKSA